MDKDQLGLLKEIAPDRISDTRSGSPDVGVGLPFSDMCAIRIYRFWCIERFRGYFTPRLKKCPLLDLLQIEETWTYIKFLASDNL